MSLDEDRARSLAAAVGVDVAKLAVQSVESPWLIFAHDRFAGPATATIPSTYRAFRADDGSTWEAYASTAPLLPSDLTPGCVFVYDDASDFEAQDYKLHTPPGFLLVPSVAGGASLGEIVDVSVAQGAQLDGAVAAAIVAEAGPGFLANDNNYKAPAISIDQVLVGFDGEIVERGRFPWWGLRRMPTKNMASPQIEAASRRMLGQLVVDTFTTSRGLELPASLPHLSNRLESAALALARHLLGTGHGIAPSPSTELAARLRRLRTLAPRIDARLIGSIVRNLFPERWAREQRVRAALEDMRA